MKRLICLLFIAIVIFTGCRKSETKQERRIVSLAPSLTGIIFELGAGGLVSGVTDSCVYKDQLEKLVSEGKIIRIAGFNSINAERIASIAPTDVYLTDSVPMEVYQSLVRIIGKEKIHSYKHPRKVEDIITMITEISATLGKESAGAEITGRMRRQLDDVKLKSAGIKKCPTFVAEIYYPPFMTVGKNTFIADLISLAGGISAVDSNTDWPSVSLEDILRMDPDVIIRLNHSREGTAAIKQIYDTRRVFSPSNIDIYLQPGIYTVDAVVELNNYIVENGPNFD